MHCAQESTVVEMKMQITMAILSLALLMWTGPASAQKTYSVSVSRHSGVPELTADEVNEILANVSKLLQKDPGHQETDDNFKCNVTLALKGPVGTFNSPGKIVYGKLDVGPLQRVNFDPDADFHVKVIEKIGYCRGKYGRARGCAYPPDLRSIIVVHPKMTIHKNVSAHVVWAHEFGHLAGLDHRKNDDYALMKCGGVTNDSVRVDRRECSCFLAYRASQACRLSPTPRFC
jgi:hypothetical protein